MFSYISFESLCGGGIGIAFLATLTGEESAEESEGYECFHFSSVGLSVRKKAMAEKEAAVSQAKAVMSWSVIMEFPTQSGVESPATMRMRSRLVFMCLYFIR